MKHKEKFAKEIVELAINGKSFAVVKDTNKIRPCEGLECALCIFSNGEVIDCAKSKKQWAEEEYVGPESVYGRRESDFTGIAKS